MVRFFCVVGPEGLAIADTGHAFLRALVDQGLKVRALPIGPAAGFLSERRWFELGSAFTTPMSIPFLNVVCANAGELMGHTTPAATFAKSQDLPPELRQLLAADGFTPDSKSADVEYVPQTVFAGLYTVGVMNVAIVTGLPDARELEALAKYDVVVFTDKDVYDDRHAAFRGNGKRGPCWFVHPESAALLPEILSEVLGCVFDTSATTERSPATAAQRATTWLPSTLRASSSRSEPSDPSRAPSPATDTSTSTLGRFWSWARRLVRR